WSAGSSIGGLYYDYTTDTVMFGTAAGKVYALDATGGARLTGYASGYAPDGNTQSITAAPLYANGVLVVGTSNGKLFFLDRGTGTTGSGTSCTGVGVIREFNFGPGVTVSAIGYDSSSNRYMVSTSSSSYDGRLYYFDAASITDPTGCK